MNWSGHNDKNAPWGVRVPPQKEGSSSKKKSPNSGGGGGGGDDDFFDDFFKGPSRIRNIILLLMGAVVLWLGSAVYRVNPDEEGIVLRFGKWVRTTDPGLHFHYPYPIETVYKPKVTQINRTEIGYRGEESRDRPLSRQILEESLMLTGDENILDVNAAVLWRIKDAQLYLFNMRSPAQTVKSVAESVVREIIGSNKIEYLFTEGRDFVQDEAHAIVQKLMDDYQSGVEIIQVQLKKVDPPEQVKDAFHDVQNAKADQERLRNQAEAYRNEIVPQARGEASRLVNEAEAYKSEVVSLAQGRAARFNSVLKSYNLNKEVTHQRIYIETLEEVMANTQKMFVDDAWSGGGLLPYMFIPELKKSLETK